MKNVIPLLLTVVLIASCTQEPEYRGNPIVTELFTADPGALVYNDTLYIFTGHDEQNTTDKYFKMNEWYVFSTTDMYNYTNHGSPLKYSDFKWCKGDAYASHAIERDGKFYWYVSARHKSIKVKEGFAIGVAVADHPTGPWTTIDEPLITDSTENSVVLNIDPAVFVDDDGQAYLFWGSWDEARMVKLKDNMIEIEGEVQTVNAKNFFEAPWIHKKDDTYYLSYAGSGYPSLTEYSTSKSITGPWEYQGVINTLLPVSETNHQAIVEFKGGWYFIYHNSGMEGGGVYRRSVCVDKLEYDENGLIKQVERTTTSVPKLN